jgi:hypothetical protein
VNDFAYDIVVTAEEQARLQAAYARLGGTDELVGDPGDGAAVAAVDPAGLGAPAVERVAA